VVEVLLGHVTVLGSCIVEAAGAAKQTPAEQMQ